MPWTSIDQFSRSSELGSIVAYTLDGFDPVGRWYFTGLALGSMRLSPAEGGFEIQDGRGLLAPSASELFFTIFVKPGELPTPSAKTFRVTHRISNLRDDGSLRYDRVFCEDKTCDICTARMIRAERHDPKDSDKLSLVGALNPTEWKNYTLDVKVLGTTAYVIRDGGLWSIDVADAANPRVLAHYPDADPLTRSNDVAIFETAGRRYAIIADSPVELVDVTDPTNLQPAGQLPVEAHTLFTETRNGSTRVYFGGLDGTTAVYDVTNPLLPARLGAFDAESSYVHDLFVEAGIGYLNAWEKGFLVVDFNDPAQPKLLGQWQSPRKQSHASWVTTVGGRRIAVHGDETYGAHMTVLDVDPASPQFMKPLSEYETRPYVSIHNFTGVGTKTYFTYYQDGVRVMDLANPAQPTLLGYYNTWDPDNPLAPDGFFGGAIGLDLDVARKLIFVADTARGLLILRDDT